jgi:hypothetical protein
MSDPTNHGRNRIQSPFPYTPFAPHSSVASRLSHRRSALELLTELCQLHSSALQRYHPAPKDFLTCMILLPVVNSIPSGFPPAQFSWRSILIGSAAVLLDPLLDTRSLTTISHFCTTCHLLTYQRHT